MAERAESQQQQVRRNYEAFLARLPQLTAIYPGKFALMRDEEIVAFFDTARDAYVAGQVIFADELFSIQEVLKTPRVFPILLRA